MRPRIEFETDAVNDYFSRDTEPGQFSLFLVNGEERVRVTDFVGPNLHNGIGTLSIKLPTTCKAGDTLSFLAQVTDPSRVEPFENRFTVRIKEKAEPSSGSGDKERKSPSGKPGKDREVPGGIALPNVILVKEDEWAKQSPPFDKYTALRIKSAGDTGTQNGDAKPTFDFYINIDNVYLKTEMKAPDRDPEVTQARFKYGLVLVGLALVHDYMAARTKAKKADEEEQDQEEDAGEVNIEQRVAEFTKAIAPVLLPMIEHLGDLDADQTPKVNSSGEAM
jgi:hypothetical protein